MQPKTLEIERGYRLWHRKRMLFSVLLVLAAIISTWGCAGNNSNAVPLPSAMITIDGKITMIGVLGTAWKKRTINIDEAWELLKDVEFEFVNPDEEKRHLNGRDQVIELQDGHPRKMPQIYSSLRLEVPIGGTTDLRQIRLTRVGDNAGRPKWKLDPGDVDSWAKRRFVHRSEVTQLISRRFP